MMLNLMLLILFILTSVYIDWTQGLSGACDGSVKTRLASELRTLYTKFDSTNEVAKQTFDCHWLINGPTGIPLTLVINYVSVEGSCPDTSLTFYNGQSNSSTLLETVCNNVTSQKQIPTAPGGQIYVIFKSNRGSGKHEFKFSYSSKLEVAEPFEESETTKIGVILAIVLGIVFLGSIFVAGTYFSVKIYMRCRNKDSEPSEMTNITNLRTERMREKTLRDDFDDSRLPRLVRGTPTTSSTERILSVKECRDAFA